MACSLINYTHTMSLQDQISTLSLPLLWQGSYNCVQEDMALNLSGLDPDLDFTVNSSVQVSVFVVTVLPMLILCLLCVVALFLASSINWQMSHFDQHNYLLQISVPGLASLCIPSCPDGWRIVLQRCYRIVYCRSPTEILHDCSLCCHGVYFRKVRLPEAAKVVCYYWDDMDGS